MTSYIADVVLFVAFSAALTTLLVRALLHDGSRRPVLGEWLGVSGCAVGTLVSGALLFL